MTLQNITDSQSPNGVNISRPDTSHWNIENCGPLENDLRVSITSALRLLPSILKTLDPDSSDDPRFTAMFKSTSMKWQVREMLELVMDHEEVRDLDPHPEKPSRPSLTCVEPDSARKFPWAGPDLWLHCSGLPPFQGLAAFSVLHGSYIFICPDFFKMPTSPNPTGSHGCMSVRGNKFSGNMHTALAYQTYMLVHELLHIYLGVGSLGLETKPVEKYLPNELVGLGAYNSYRNPSNYQLYLSCESFSERRMALTCKY